MCARTDERALAESYLVAYGSVHSEYFVKLLLLLTGRRAAVLFVHFGGYISVARWRLATTVLLGFCVAIASLTLLPRTAVDFAAVRVRIGAAASDQWHAKAAGAPGSVC